jgi:hypothetical protein
VSGGATDSGDVRTAHDARREVAPVVVVIPVLLVLLALVSWDEKWDVLGLPWWTWILLAVPALLVSVDIWFGTRVQAARTAALALLGVVLAGNLAGLVLLVAALIRTHEDDLGGGQLLFTAAAIWTTNVIVFGIAFWELDRGGPVTRRSENPDDPDFRFPQDEDGPTESGPWRARVWDYLYLSLTNSTAFSPTDAMPLTVRAKGFMAIEAVVSFVLVVLVTARAVNVLG